MVGPSNLQIFKELEEHLTDEIYFYGVRISWDLTDMYQQEKKKRETLEKRQFMDMDGKIYMIELSIL